ncbi:TatD family hydrolase [Desulfobacula toluolica]|uniref:TatD2: Mg-dependent deoxyribonuclease n=1 Tax=Desulfobacula toluolica (strain DSM 7467 / Tol2) TaxID=651182 RepID=K0NLJ9_DESTT|nr:TatD family hydrolase [Desulfobacula toluolica]CCK82441.1 TatD2: Mg-dependent deoxyribonuclease [Desulfobacula toluolica Tol2]
MILFDSHCHIDDNCYDKDRQDVIDRAEAENIQGIMIVGIDIETSLKAIEIARENDHIITSVGIHPHDAKQCSADTMNALIRLAMENSCVKAWGEIGLDYNRMFSPEKDQEDCFKTQLEAADNLDLPLIFHERDSKGRFYDILKSDGPKSRKGVIHCFSGTKEELFKYLDLGYYIGITGILTLQKRGEYLRTLAPLIPEDRILIETDAPYLTPAPQKNKNRRNEPVFVKSVLLKLAEIRKSDPKALAQTIFNNTRTLYNVDL